MMSGSFGGDVGDSRAQAHSAGLGNAIISSSSPPRHLMNASAHPQPELFRHVSVEKAALYRAIMASFAAAKRQFRPHLRPDEVLAEACWEHLPARPQPEEVQAALSQLTEWGNLEAQADTGRVNSLTDFYHLKSIYRLSQGGEAVEAALETFARTLARRAELQSVALEDILSEPGAHPTGIALNHFGLLSADRADSDLQKLLDPVEF